VLRCEDRQPRFHEDVVSRMSCCVGLSGARFASIAGARSPVGATPANRPQQPSAVARARSWLEAAVSRSRVYLHNLHAGATAAQILSPPRLGDPVYWPMGPNVTGIGMPSSDAPLNRRAG
jgi:hypothetical protein